MYVVFLLMTRRRRQKGLLSSRVPSFYPFFPTFLLRGARGFVDEIAGRSLGHLTSQVRLEDQVWGRNVLLADQTNEPDAGFFARNQTSNLSNWAPLLIY